MNVLETGLVFGMVVFGSVSFVVYFLLLLKYLYVWLLIYYLPLSYPNDDDIEDPNAASLCLDLVSDRRPSDISVSLRLLPGDDPLLW